MNVYTSQSDYIFEEFLYHYVQGFIKNGEFLIGIQWSKEIKPKDNT